MATGDERLRLLVKAQVERAGRPAAEAASAIRRIELDVGDKPTREHLREVASCDVCVSPARWEGLGLPSTRRSPSGCRRSRTMRRR